MMTRIQEAKDELTANLRSLGELMQQHVAGKSDAVLPCTTADMTTQQLSKQKRGYSLHLYCSSASRSQLAVLANSLCAWAHEQSRPQDMPFYIVGLGMYIGMHQLSAAMSAAHIVCMCLH